jgi:hypothetical protein
MNILRFSEIIEDWWLEKIPLAIWTAIKWIGWVVGIFPFVFIGYIAQFVISRVTAGFMAGWIIARDDDD